jgi:nucleotide-binding universal stress UspA family protein
MKKILFPTDFSDTSINAFEYALKVANQLGATISTIHTFITPIVGSTPVVMVEQMTELTEQLEMQEYTAFNKKIHQLAIEEDLTHIQIEHTLEFGLTISEIINISKKEAIDLIIMGSEGAEGLQKWLFGSHAASVIEKATCPVLIIPNEVVYQPISKIAYATNFEAVDDDILEYLLEWIGKFDAELDFVHVADKGESIDAEQYANMSEITELAKRYENVRFKILYDKDIIDELEVFVEEEKIDMLVMVTHKYPFFKRLFNPSLTRKMAFDTEMPLLVFQAPMS